MQSVASSSNFRFPERQFHIHEGWVTEWDSRSATYIFQNSRTRAIQEAWPGSHADQISLSTRYMFNYDPQGRKKWTLKILSDLESDRPLLTNMVSEDVAGITWYLSLRLGRPDVVVNDDEAGWANLVNIIEAERKLQLRTSSKQIDFLYERLREARAIIERLLVDTSYQEGGDLGTSSEIVRREKSSLFMAAPPDNSSVTSLSMTEEPATLGGALSQGTALNLPLPPEETIQGGPVSIQSNGTKRGTADEGRINTALRSATSSTRKRKRSTQKDPEKFKYKCEACGERFTRSTTLREHGRSHSGERPFPCRNMTCSKAFARIKDRNRHEELHGEKKYKCFVGNSRIPGQCGREFAREDGLIAHWRTEKGWRCLLPLLERFVLRYLKYGNGASTESGGYYCRMISNSCGTHFTQVEDLEAHLINPANKKCSAEWLIKSVLDRDSFTQNLSEPERPAVEHNEDQGSRDVQEALLASTSQESQAGQATYQDPSPHIEERAEPFRAVSPSGSVAVDNEQGMTAPVSEDEPRSLEESLSDFDPFDSWTLVETECVEVNGVLAAIRIDIRSTRHPTVKCNIIVETLEVRTQENQWWVTSRGRYRGQLFIESWYAATMIGKGVYVAYRPDYGPEKIFPIGTLDFDSTDRRFKIFRTPEPKSSANIGPIPETVEERPAIQDASMVTPGNIPSIDYINNSTDQRHAAIEEAIIDRSHAVDAPISGQENQLGVLESGSPLDGLCRVPKPGVVRDFSNWTIASSGFNIHRRQIWAYVQCPQEAVYSAHLYCRSGLLRKRAKIVPVGVHFQLSFIIDYLNAAALGTNILHVDLIILDSYGKISASLELGGLHWTHMTQEWSWTSAPRL